MPATYLDSSAIVKLAVEEPQSAALRRHLRPKRPPRVECARARGRAVLARWDLLRLKDRVLSVAGMLMPADLHSLDAIHLATAQVLGSDLARVVTYDEHIGEGAGHVGLQTASPT